MPFAVSSEEVTSGAAIIAALAAIAGALVAIRNTGKQLEAQDMPFVIAVPQRRGGWIRWETGGEDGFNRLLGQLWNVGKGPAIIGDMRLTIQGTDVMAPAGGEIPLAASDLQKHSPQLLGVIPEGRGELRIYYTHSSGSEYLTRSEVVAGPDGLLCKDFKRESTDGEARPFTH